MGLFDKLFSNTVKKVAEKTIEEETKKDPSLAEKLKLANDVAKKGEKHLKSMTKEEREKYLDDLDKELGV